MGLACPLDPDLNTRSGFVNQLAGGASARYCREDLCSRLLACPSGRPTRCQTPELVGAVLGLVERDDVDREVDVERERCCWYFYFSIKEFTKFSPAYILQNFIIEMETVLEIYGQISDSGFQVSEQMLNSCWDLKFRKRFSRKIFLKLFQNLTC